MFITRSGLGRMSISYYKNLNLASTGDSFHASDLTITRTSNYIPKPPCDAKIMTFGAFHTDHMFEVDWQENKGWTRPKIVPFQSLSLHPFSSCLHYALECFEGAKAYKTKSGQIRTFRLDCNMYRMKQTAHRLCLPDFDGNEFMKCIEQLLKVDQEWIPTEPGFSAYIRPTLIATEETLGVRAPTRAKLFAAISPVGPYFPSGFKPVKIFCNTKHIRAAKGGCGGYKIGANYAPTIKPNLEVAKSGFSQSLWMLPDGQVQEMGVCNLFIYWINKDGKKELVTPTLDGTILPGVVRDSILELVREKHDHIVTERLVYIDEIVAAFKEGRMLEMFGSGTAVVVQPIEAIGYNDQTYNLTLNPKYSSGDLTHWLYEQLSNIQQGSQPHKWINIV